VVSFEDGYLNPAGYIHAGCVAAYAETTETAMERIRNFSPDLSELELDGITEAIEC
jgi:hypothetical protein